MSASSEHPAASLAEAVAPVERPCPVCDAELALFQPDEELDDRILAVCIDCKAWFLLICTSPDQVLVFSENDGRCRRIV